jgi:hypothetical protein
MRWHGILNARAVRQFGGTAGPDLGERWPARLVATAAEDRLSIRHNRHIRRCCAGACASGIKRS